jgi:hypothetical protein
MAFFTALPLKAQSVPENNIAENLHNLDRLSGITEIALSYHAPDIELQDAHSLAAGSREQITATKTRRPANIEAPQYTMQETWLINAGYYKTTNYPDWHKARRTSGKRQSGKYLASEF